MARRRQERLARVVKETVSDAITNHLNDPRIEAFVSVTKVDVAGDLRSANVYLSMFGKDDNVQERTFKAIMHAKNRIQAILGDALQSKFCPVIHLHKDENFKKTLETMRLIDQAAGELRKADSAEPGAVSGQL